MCVRVPTVDPTESPLKNDDRRLRNPTSTCKLCKDKHSPSPCALGVGGTGYPLFGVLSSEESQAAASKRGRGRQGASWCKGGGVRAPDCEEGSRKGEKAGDEKGEGDAREAQDKGEVKAKLGDGERGM